MSSRGPPNIRPLVQRPRNNQNDTRWSSWLLGLLLLTWQFILKFFVKKEKKNEETNQKTTQIEEIDPEEIRRRRLNKFKTYENQIASSSSVYDNEIASSSTQTTEKPLKIASQTNQKIASSDSLPKPVQKNNIDTPLNDQQKPTSEAKTNNISQDEAKSSSTIETEKSTVITAITESKESLIISRLFNVRSKDSPASIKDKGFIEIDFSLKNRDFPNFEVSDIDSLLFTLSSHFNTGKLFMDYLLQCYIRSTHLRAQEMLQICDSAKRSIETQFFLQIQQDPDLLKILLDFIKSCLQLNYSLTSSADLSIKECEILLQKSLSNFSIEELSFIFDPIISSMVSDISKDLALDQLSNWELMALFFANQQLRKMLVLHPFWRTSNLIESNSNQINRPKFIHETILGSMLYFSFFKYRANGEAWFPGPFYPSRSLQSNQMIETNTNMYSSRIRTARNIVYSIFASLRADESLRSEIFVWIKNHICDGPFKPNSLQYSLQWTSNGMLQANDGFFSNLFDIFASLCAPITDPSSRHSKFHLLDPEFIKHNQYGLAFDNDSSLFGFDEQNNDLKKEAKNHGFVSSIFFTTSLILHHGYIPTTDHWRLLTTEISKLVRQDSNLRANGAPESQRDPLIHRINDLLSKLYQLNVSIGTKEDIDKSLNFMAFCCEWLFSLGIENVGFNNVFDEKMKLIPSYFIHDIVSYIKWVVTMTKSPLPGLSPIPLIIPDSIIKFLTILLKCPKMTNYHILSTVVETLTGIYAFSFVPGKLFDLSKVEIDLPITSNPSAELKELIVPLLNYYVNVEKTGSRSQFYDKFPLRMNVSILIRACMNFTASNGPKQLLMQLTNDHELFIPLVTVLLGDTLYLLDEILNKIQRIREIQKILKASQNSDANSNQIASQSNDQGAPSNASSNAHSIASRRLEQQQQVPLDEQRRFELNQELSSSQDQLRALSTFGNESLLLFEILCALSLQNALENRNVDKCDSPALLHPEVVDQLATMLNYYLDHFASIKKRKLLFLKSADLTEQSQNGSLAFDPKQILSCLVLCYLDLHKISLILAKKQSKAKPIYFVDHVVTESRSFNMEMFESTLQVISTKCIPFIPTFYSLKPIDTTSPTSSATPSSSSDGFEDFSLLPKAIISDFISFNKILNERSSVTKQEEIPLDDVPDEFLDELMSTLMKDPVKLPSGHYVDKLTIKRHLEGHDKSDPFTRQPMTVDMIQTDLEMKQKIEAWLEDRKSKK